MMRFARSLDEVGAGGNAWRTPLTGPASNTGARKEWMHFCVALPSGGQVLVNLNVTESGGRRVPRLIVLGWDRSWCGSVRSFADDEVSGGSGRLDVRLGPNRLRWHEGAFQLSLATPELTGELELVPSLLPTVPTTVSLGAGRSLHWIVLPRLLANGWVRLGSERHLVARAPAYHDHNWGNFRWGGDLGWEWGFLLPESGDTRMSVVVVRVSDGLGHKSASQTALVWRESRLVRVFQNHELEFESHGTRPPARPFTVPRVASLLAPAASSGVPARFATRARGAGDSLDFDFSVHDAARVALPSETDPFKLLLLNETTGRARASGSIGGERFELEGDAMMEFVRG
jgi:hypothetical protein